MPPLPPSLHASFEPFDAFLDEHNMRGLALFLNAAHNYPHQPPGVRKIFAQELCKKYVPPTSRAPPSPTFLEKKTHAH